MANKLELTWIGKEDRLNVEPRVFIENGKLSYTSVKLGILDENFDAKNILIHGDNLLALKALTKEYTNKIKCIYIDPPYNTGSAFEHYDDNLEHSIWLNMMNERLRLLHNLLNDTGTFWCQIDYNEFAYLKVLLDEIFGRSNFITCITVKSKAGGGVGQESYLFDLNEYILVYRKTSKVAPNNVPYKEEPLGKNVTDFYNNYITSFGIEEELSKITGGTVGDIKVIRFNDFKVNKMNASERNDDNYYMHFDKIFRTTNPQGGLMKRVMPQIPNEGLIGIEYIPSKGRDAGKLTRYYFYKGSLIVWLKDTAFKNDQTNKISKLVRNDNLWVENLHQGIAQEGTIKFKQSKKPEKLIQRILEIATKPGDLVLDSFLGSGTTAAVAHKMGRKWIGIEMGEHAYTHCKVRLDKVIDGEQGGISKSVNWQGGGGYKFYELAPTLIKTDAFGQQIINPEYNAEMLASAVAIHEGYKYNPDSDCYWKQSSNESNSYLYVTTKHINKEAIDSILTEMKPDEFLVIVCKSFDTNSVLGVKNISIKKIPQSLLKNCEFDVDNYNLNIINPPEYDDEDGEIDE